MNSFNAMTFCTIYYIIMIVENRIENLDKFKKYFWDSDVSAIDIIQYKFYIIERILEFGNVPEVKWMFDNYSTKAIKEILDSSRNISEKSSSFWKIFLGFEKCT